VTRRLLLIALMNAAPVAVSSTVFLFFVGSVLDAEGWEGGLLILYFLAAAGTIPIWSRLAARHGERPVLLVAMAAGDRDLFRGPDAGRRGRRHLRGRSACYLVRVIGADFAILPALFARRMADIAP
jgi:GPH family glycoside/pentoside/hexuronide:cation symporter